MLPYFLLVAFEVGLIVLFYGYKKVSDLKNSQLWYLGLAFFAMFFFSSFRAPHLGTDYHSYIFALDYVKTTGTYYMEAGYILLNKIVLLFTDHYFGVAIATNLMTMVPLLVMILLCVERKYWPICVMIFLLNPYMYLQSTFNIMRQGCATGLVIAAVMCLTRKKLWKKLLSVVFIVCAALFHRMAFSMLVLIPVMLIPWKKKWWVIIGSIALGINMFGLDLFSLAIRFLSSKYVGYEGSLLNIGVYAMFIFALILVICHFYDKLCEDVKHKQFIDLYLLSLSYLLVALPNDIAYRIYIMLAFTAIPAVPVIWEKLGAVRVEKIPVIGKLRLWKKYPKVKSFMPVVPGYTLYYFGFFTCYILYFCLTKNTAYIPFSFGF